MPLIFVIITIIDLLLIIMVMIGALQLIKRQEQLKTQHFLIKKRDHFLRDFTAIYRSYCLCRRSNTNKEEHCSIKEQLHQLLQNDYLNKELDSIENLYLRDSSFQDRTKLHRIDRLSEDYQMLYGETGGREIQSFIFWYRILVAELMSNDKRGYENDNLLSKHVASLSGILKNLEESYQAIEKQNLLDELECKSLIKSP